jgi:CRP/FNR family transcriptional regulator
MVATTLTAETDRETVEQARLISRAALFSGLRASRLTDLAQHAFTQHLEPGDLLFREGDRGTSMYVLGSGRIRLYLTTPEGETTVAMLEPGATFGELAVFDRGPRSASAVAEEPSMVVGIPAQAVRAAYRADPDLSDNLLRSLAALVRAANTQRSTVVFWDLVARVSAVLLNESDAHDGQLWLGPHTAELAARAGGSEKAVLGILHQFEREGLVAFEGQRAVILNRDALEIRAMEAA